MSSLLAAQPVRRALQPRWHVVVSSPTAAPAAIASDTSACSSRAPHRSAPRRSAPRMSARREIDAAEIGADQVRAAEVGRPQIGAPQVAADQIGSRTIARRRPAAGELRGPVEQAARHRPPRSCPAPARRPPQPPRRAAPPPASSAGLGQVPEQLVAPAHRRERLEHSGVRTRSRARRPRAGRRRSSRTPRSRESPIRGATLVDRAAVVGRRFGQATPAGLSIAKSADAVKDGATQHRATQPPQSRAQAVTVERHRHG